jgi:catechol 2,3-dioxygenase-like lactoylglutathione lyase family enzyme
MREDCTVPISFRASPDVILRTPNFAAATHFYRSVLGLEVAHHGPALQGFDAGSFRLYVEEGPPHGAVFDFWVSDLAAAKSALLAAGCTVVEENPDVPRCYIRDPYGLVFNIEQRAPLLASGLPA